MDMDMDNDSESEPTAGWPLAAPLLLLLTLLLTILVKGIGASHGTALLSAADARLVLCMV